MRQLDLIEEQYKFYSIRLSSTQQYSQSDVMHIIVSALSAIDRIAGKDSIYSKEAHLANSRNSTDLPSLIGILRALRGDIANGYLDNLKEIIHGEMFSDFLDMAEYLLKEGYKDAAAVMIGGVLESHLRQLAIKHSIDIEIVTNTEVKAKKADKLNTDLYAKKVYNLLEQKNVIAWLDLRNKAAHARYEEYTKDHVSLMLQGVRIFLSHHPA